MITRRRTWAGAAAVAAVVAGGALAGPASAATVVTPNACQYSYDTYWRDIPISLTGSVAAGSAERGDTVELEGLGVGATLPTWMAEYGYRFGLLREGYNEIPATVWIAVEGANTVEGVRVFEVDAIAHTTVTVDGQGRPQPAPMVYDIPDLPDSAWTARGGEVTFRQALPGSLPPLPAGPGGSTVVPVGSVYIQARLGAAILGLDCLPGGFIADGASHSNLVPDPIDTVDVPAFTCIARRPGSTNASPVDVRITRFPVPGGASGARTLNPVLSYAIPNDWLESLRDAGDLPTGASTARIAATAAIDGTGTVEPRQVATGETPVSVALQVSGGSISVGGVNGADLAGQIPLSATTWTPSGSAPMRMGVAPPGALGTISVEGTGNVTPYGAVHLWTTVTPSAGAPVRIALDCVSGDVTVQNAGVAYSPLGNQAGGDGGRFGIAAYPLAPFAIAALDSPLPPATPRPVTPAPAAPAPVVQAPPPAKARTAAPPRPTATVLRVKGKAVLRVRATLPRTAAGRVVVIERQVGRRVLPLAKVTVPRTGRIDRRIILKRTTKTGATGIKGTARFQVRLRIVGTSRATAASGRFRVVAVPRALR